MASGIAHRTAAIVVAGGSGTRFGSPKHTLRIDGKELWEHCRDAFRAAGIDQIIVVGDVPGGVTGGARRQDSVANGLATVRDADFVLVHDAARPLVTPRLIAAVLDRLEAGGVDGVVPALPMTDTVKRVSGDMIEETVDRTALVTVQTPQGFSCEALNRVHSEIGDGQATDDASMVERAGGRVAVVDGDANNIKVTYPLDLDRARQLSKRQGG